MTIDLSWYAASLIYLRSGDPAIFGSKLVVQDDLIVLRSGSREEALNECLQLGQIGAAVARQLLGDASLVHARQLAIGDECTFLGVRMITRLEGMPRHEQEIERVAKTTSIDQVNQVAENPVSLRGLMIAGPAYGAAQAAVNDRLLLQSQLYAGIQVFAGSAGTTNDIPVVERTVLVRATSPALAVDALVAQVTHSPLKDHRFVGLADLGLATHDPVSSGAELLSSIYEVPAAEVSSFIASLIQAPR